MDQPTKRINGKVHGGLYGWFMRIYEGKQLRLARTFSDRAAGGMLAALRAALAFHAAHVGIAVEQGYRVSIAFRTQKPASCWRSEVC